MLTRPLTWGACLVMLALSVSTAGKTMSENPSVEERNKNMVKTSFDHWKDGTGSPFELLDAAATWTIVGTSPLSRTYGSRQEFLDKIINPFNARMSKRLIPSVRGLYADGDTVVILFDATATARDGRPYRNTYTWYLTIKDAKVVSVIALFDTREFDDLWSRVSPSS
jgi:ketosteroid isomerase-like protein